MYYVISISFLSPKKQNVHTLTFLFDNFFTSSHSTFLCFYKEHSIPKKTQKRFVGNSFKLALYAKISMVCVDCVRNLYLQLLNYIATCHLSLNCHDKNHVMNVVTLSNSKPGIYSLSQ